MDFDIQYLLALQDLRNATGNVFNEFFNALSKFAVDILPLLPFAIFWGLDKKWGYFFLINQWVGEVLNGVIKLTACAYRPWIRSDLIEPAGDSKVAATGYSFPSGHTMVSTVLYGSAFVWQRKKRRWLAAICAVLILLTGFSRNFLGVHTPQDVIVGFVESVLIIAVVSFLQKKINGNQKVLDILTVVGAAAVVIVLIYIQVKPYPMDYDSSGNLLVDPSKMMNDCFKACGGLLGFLVGSFIDRHYLHYRIPEGAKSLPILVFLGAAIAYSWTYFFGPATFVEGLGGHWGNFILRLILLLFVTVLWPAVITKICKEKEA